MIWGALDSKAIKTGLLDAFLIGVIAAFFIQPLFSVVYFDNWGSIESTFMAHARFLVEGWPHPEWQPLWYAGTRFDYVYPPALPYGTALLHMTAGVPIAHAYHLYTGVLYVLGIAGIYVFVRIWSESRWMAWAAAIGTVMASPSFLLIEPVRIDAMDRYYLPQRLNALIHWGEGPHISSLSLIPPAMAAAYWAMTRSSRWAAAVAAILCALAVSNNFYGSVSLSVVYLLMVWSLWITRPDKKLLLWAAGIPVLAYGLTAVWLVPSYFRITLENLATVEASGESSDALVAVILVGAFLALSARYGYRRPERSYAIFVSGFAVTLFALVLTHYWFDLHVLGTPSRLIPELDLAIWLLLLEALRRVVARAEPRLAASRWSGPAAVALLALALAATPYPRNAWRLYAEDPSPEERIEYRLTSWIEQNMPESRLFVDGSLRFWYNVWRDLPQLSGGSNQGMLNRETLFPFWDVRLAEDPRTSILWLQGFGVDGVVVHGEGSQEIFRNFDFKQKYDGVLPVIHDRGEGDKIYRIPRRYPELARVVKRSAVEALQPVENSWEVDRLEAYVKAVEEGPDVRPRLEWQGHEALEVSATIAPDELLLVQISYDPAWAAYVDGQPVETRRDVLGLMLVEAPPGEPTVRLQFETPLENKVGGALTVLSLLAAAGMIVTGIRRR